MFHYIIINYGTIVTTFPLLPSFEDQFQLLLVLQTEWSVSSKRINDNQIN